MRQVTDGTLSAEEEKGGSIGQRVGGITYLDLIKDEEGGGMGPVISDKGES